MTVAAVVTDHVGATLLLRHSVVVQWQQVIGRHGNAGPIVTPVYGNGMWLGFDWNVPVLTFTTGDYCVYRIAYYEIVTLGLHQLVTSLKKFPRLNSTSYRILADQRDWLTKPSLYPEDLVVLLVPCLLVYGTKRLEARRLETNSKSN